MEVAIIGGGISGLYCASRMLEEGVLTDSSGKHPSITIYEKSGRVGGKIRSERVQGGAEVLEHGAWRFSSSHTLVQKLLNGYDKFDYPDSRHTDHETRPKGYMSQFASWLFQGSPFQGSPYTAAFNDLDSGYADSSARADTGSRHTGRYQGLKGGYEKIIGVLFKMLPLEKDCSKKASSGRVLVRTGTRVRRLRRKKGRLTFEVWQHENVTLSSVDVCTADIVVFACSPNHAAHASSDAIRRDLRILQASIMPLPLCRVYGRSDGEQKSRDRVTDTPQHRCITLAGRHWNIVSYTSGRVANAWRDLLVHRKKKAEAILRTQCTYYYYAEGTHMWKPAHRFDKGRQARLAVRIRDDMFIVGEALSDMQGWAEGALRSVEALMDDLKRTRPASSSTPAAESDSPSWVTYRGRRINLSGWAKRHPGGPDLIADLEEGQAIDEIFDDAHLSDEPWKQLFALQDPS